MHEMKLHPLTLSFSGQWRHLEKEFLTFRHTDSLGRVRAALIAAVFFYAIFGFLDAAVAPESRMLFWGIRYGVVCPLGMLVFFFTWHPRYETWSQPTLFALCFTGGIGIVLMVVVSSPPATYYYYAGIILIFIHIFTFLRMKFTWAVICTWLIVGCYEAASLWLTDTPRLILISNNFFFISANIFCMLAGYAIEQNERKNYFLNHLLSLEKEKVSNVNRLLDTKVKDRTRELDVMNRKLKAEIDERIAHEASSRRLEAELNRARRMEAIGTLAGGIAHDFNNILSAVIGYSELLLDEVGEESRFHEDLTGILNAAIRGKDLSRQILTFSRQTEQEVRPVRMDRLVQEAMKLIKATLPATITIRQKTEIAASVLADPGQLHRIIVNLCTNAAHAIGSRNGTITVALEETGPVEGSVPDSMPSSQGSHVCLSVTDTGCGMTSEVMEKIFDPFFTTKPMDKGTGMGLSVVHGIVTQAGGNIRVNSRPGKGTRIDVFLPVTHVQDDSEVLDEQERYHGSGHILVVDDEETVATAIARSLKILGYSVSDVTTPHKAIELFRNAPLAFDLVISDFAMPGMTGLELASSLKTQRPDIPVILLTGYGEDLSREAINAAGVNTFLVKPVRRHVLGREVKQLLEKNQE